MGSSGHFARLVKLLTTDIHLSDIEDCGTLHPIAICITNKKMLGKMVGRWYRKQYERDYKLLKGTETDLIGEVLLFRDPSTCAVGASKVCRKCYGELSKVNEDISIGGYASTKITRPVSQNILSTKHLLTTMSEKIEFPEAFDRFFTISSNIIEINNETEENIDDYKIVIQDKMLFTLEDFEEDDYNAYVYNFQLVNKRTGEAIIIFENKRKEMFISPEFYKYMQKHKKRGAKVYDDEGELINTDYYEIDMRNIESEVKDMTHLFMIQIENNELTKPLYSIMHLLDRSDRGIGPEDIPITTIDQLTQRFLELLIEADIDALGVHASLILMPLIRKTDNILERPDFREYNTVYRMLTVKGALEKHPNVNTSLSFQFLDRQLKSLDTYLKVSGSYLDPFFKKTL